MAETFELYQDKAREWRWRFRHEEGIIIADSAEDYIAKAGALNQIESVKENAPTAPIKEDKTKFIVSSDWHCQPDRLILEAKKLIEKAKSGEDILVGVGDLFDFIPLGMDKFKNSQAIEDFIKLLDGQTFYYVCGNHDPYRWVKRRFKYYPNIEVRRELKLENKWYFRHGHGWSADWRYFRHIAPLLTERMTEYFPGTWYRFSKWMGWIPSERKKKSDVGGSEERKKYDDAVGIVWRRAIHHAQHNNLSVVIGHTHCTGTMRRAMNGVKTVMADGGKLEEKTYLEIDDDIRLCILSFDMSLQDITLSNLPRLQELRDLHFARRPEICLELPRLITRYMKTKDNPGDNPELRAAKRLKYVLENKRPIIEDGTLLAGTTTAKLTGAIMYPDFLALPIWPELETVHRRKKNSYGITPEEIEELNSQIFPYWMDRTVQEVARRIYDNPLCQRVMERIIFFICGKAGTISHTIPDYTSVVERGLKALKADAEEKERSMVNLKQDQNGAYYYQAVKLVIEGVLAYAENLSREAARLARTEQNKKRKRELEKMREICARVPGEPSQSLHDALNAIWICKIALHQENANAGLSLGRLDQILYKLYSDDIKNGVLTLAEAVELVGCFWLKIADHVPLAPKLGEEIVGGAGSNQAITLGGVDSEGYDAVNDLTDVMLKATELLRLRDPNVNCRYYPPPPGEVFDRDRPNLFNSPEYLHRLCEVNIDTGATPCFHNDPSNIETLRRQFQDQGITWEHARDYAIVGCVEPVSSGRTFGHTGAIYINLTSALELALFQGKHRLIEDDLFGEEIKAPENIESFPESFPDFKREFEKQLNWLIDQAVTMNNNLGRVHQMLHPTPLLSTLTEGCMKNGKDVIDGGALYNSSGVTIIGLAEVTDSLSAIQEFVFDKGAVSFDKMIEAIKHNWNDPYRKLHQMVRTSEEKYGTDSKMAKENADYLIDFLHGAFQSKQNYRGGKYTVGYWTLTLHAGLGLLTGALPSGRVKGDPLPSGITPVSGSAPDLSSCLNFVAHLDHTKIANGHAFNLKYTPSHNREQTVTKFAGSVEGYMQMGGLQVQFNIIDRDNLKKAMENPKNNQDLLVRVSGYTAYFVDLDPSMQNEIITRAEYNLETGREVKYQ